MARILIGWELGANTGHIVKLAGIAGELAARGHEPVFAVQQIGTVPPGYPVWQAPLWPTQLATLSRRAETAPATMGDILAVLGLGDAAAMRAIIAAWDGLLAAVRPDVVAAEFAPGLMMSAIGRVPLLGLGTGFSLPPAHLPVFASLTGQPAAQDETVLLDAVNAALRANARPPLDRLTQIFTSDLELPAVFREIDPYREWRRSAYGAPSVMPAPALATGGGDELFVYMNGLIRWPDGFWQGLVDSRLKVRVHDPRLSDADAAVLTGAGLIVERRPVPFDRIVARSRMALSHGGLGMACSALLAGLPMAFMPFDIEKKMVAASVVTLGLGARLDFELVEAARLAAMLRATFENEALHARARAAAPGFRDRMGAGCERQTADAVESLLG
ncbi:glycosyltransferase [Sphingomonas solaris]|uniref:Glycosyl transferase-like UDP-glucuronosyltransferase n=1 Tax=Alterirhizorhabdus solaris TaxID=2529389 RepID=A0A558QXG2_9SPHN|nr:glycosyl transferase-like UDP-glucuronosyltransferase [Sphingomonas solaris]TVV71841.1 glycosyl transferase-like UDP-glucuronosyltransferase [Sphingomonas solaris]